jgi:hypothetical protein
MDEAESQLRLEASTSGLADRVPLVSARSLVSKGQRNWLIGLGVAFVLGVVISARLTFTAILALVTLIYLIAVVYRVTLFIRSSKSENVEMVTDEEALRVPESELPSYTVMIAAYREASVIGKLIEHMSSLDYPADRIEVLLLIEEDDEETLETLRQIDPGPQFKLIVVPPGEPRTKPKALNFGLTLAQGDLVAVFDVEDEPDVLQLRRAAVTMARFGPALACVQAKLLYGNWHTSCGSPFFSLAWCRCMLRFHWEEHRTTSGVLPCVPSGAGTLSMSRRTVILGSACFARATR